MLEQEGITHEVRLYMKDQESMNVVEFEGVLEALDLDALDLVRVNEALWKE
ncbi:MAG TPA: arsenate reductase, partial [Cryomorphaceae bacterium]|nr:arsenate reductase [Cryomorphaceae bacterium]